jgi:hypothetical protein
MEPVRPSVRMLSQEEALAQVQGELTRVRYRITSVPVAGHELWIGVCEAEAYDDRAVLRAILQRDVAQYLGAYR